MCQRNILGSTLIRRNDTISLMQEKIRLLEKMLQQGQLWSEKLLSRLKLRNSEISGLKKQLEILSTQRVESQIRFVQSEREKETQMSVLARRLAVDSITQNVHRWRILEAKGATNDLELISRLRVLQRIIIDKSKQLEEAAQKFEEKDRLFFEIKKFFAKQMFPEKTSNVINALKHDMIQKNRKIKVKYV